ncbi:hypothetical protein JNUCC23_20710 [Peribacillus sp. JNUCC 23]
MKKFSTLLLTGALVLSTAVPAFADTTPPDAVAGTPIETVDGGVTGQSVVSEASLELPTIKVTLPSSHGFIVNPYNIGDAGQIVSAAAEIKNESDIAVDVSLKSTVASIKGAVGKLAILGPVTNTTTTKTVELNLMVTAEVAEGTVHPQNGKVNITGKNTSVKLATLPETTGKATLKYDGKAVANPVGNPWTAADEITVTSVYTFTPVANTTP